MSPMSDLGPFEPLWAILPHWSDVRFVLHARSTVWPATDVSQKFSCVCVRVHVACVTCSRHVSHSLRQPGVSAAATHHRTRLSSASTTASTPSASTSAQSNVRLRHALRFLIACPASPGVVPGVTAAVPGSSERRSVDSRRRLSERSVAARHRHGQCSAKRSVAAARRLSVCSANFSTATRHFPAEHRHDFRSNGQGGGTLMAGGGGLLAPSCGRRRVGAVLAPGRVASQAGLVTVEVIQ